MYIISHLSYDVDGAHQQLVQVTVYHEGNEVDQGVLKAGPDLQPQLVRNAQCGA